MYKISFDLKNEELINKFEIALIDISDISYDKIEQNGFDGSQLVIYIFTGSTGVIVIKSLEKIIVELIKNLSERNKDKSLTIGEISLNGYSYKQAIKIINTYFQTKDETEINEVCEE